MELTTSQLSTNEALQFMLAGNAIVTFRSTKTGVRYTYKIRKSNDNKAWFVNLLSGPDNTSDYQYMGQIRHGKFSLTEASKLSGKSTPVVAFRWAFNHLCEGTPTTNMEIWHEGRCGRCGRTLTVPESIANGIGPECSKKG